MLRRINIPKLAWNLSSVNMFLSSCMNCDIFYLPTCGLCWGTNYWLALWNVCHVGKYISVRYYPLPVICHDKIISNIITVIIIESRK